MKYTGDDAGWYRDPTGRRKVRYFDGEAWTERAGGRRPWHRPGRLATVLTVVIGIPAAVAAGVGIAIATEDPLPTAPSPEAKSGEAPAAVVADLEAIGQAIEDFYAATGADNVAPPKVASDGIVYTFTLEDGSDLTWEAPDVAASPGVRLEGQDGYDAYSWCVWVTLLDEPWHLRADGVVTQDAC